MRHNTNTLVKVFSAVFSTPEPIVELGSFQVPGQEKISNLRPYFSKKKYIGCDIRKGRGVDRLENMEKLTFLTSSVGTIISIDTLEHVSKPYLAVKEIYRVLKPGGLLLLVSTMDFPIHDCPFDYWRFTPEGLKLLLSDFEEKYIGFEGNVLKPKTVLAIAVKKPSLSHLKQIKKLVSLYKKTPKMDFWEWAEVTYRYWRTALTAFKPWRPKLDKKLRFINLDPNSHP